MQLNFSSPCSQHLCRIVSVCPEPDIYDTHMARNRSTFNVCPRPAAAQSSRRQCLQQAAAESKAGQSCAAVGPDDTRPGPGCCSADCGCPGAVSSQLQAVCDCTLCLCIYTVTCLTMAGFLSCNRPQVGGRNNKAGPDGGGGSHRRPEVARRAALSSLTNLVLVACHAVRHLLSNRCHSLPAPPADSTQCLPTCFEMPSALIILLMVAAGVRGR